PGPVGVFPKGSLFGLATVTVGNSTTGTIYLINPTSGDAQPIGSSFGLTTSDGYDIDFSPVDGRLRVVDNKRNNVLFDLTTGHTVNGQTALSVGSNIVGAAYDRNTLHPDPVNGDPNALGTRFTTLFDIDFATDSLVRQGSVNGTPPPAAN